MSTHSVVMFYVDHLLEHNFSQSEVDCEGARDLQLKAEDDHEDQH